MRIWLRAETKPGETRSPLTPLQARQLIDRGWDVAVEATPRRVFRDEEYAAAGCRMVEDGTWPDAPGDTVILGLKHLPEADFALRHTHIYFAHVFKEQEGWRDTLGRFADGGGTLLDLEFLVDERGRRVAAFGYWAGFVGAALGLDVFSHQRLAPTSEAYPEATPYPDSKSLVRHVRNRLEEAVGGGPETCRAIVIGALGRVGSGAVDLLERVGLEPARWDLAETRGGGPFAEILDYDLLVNAVLVTKRIPPFLTDELLDRRPRQLSVIADVSCDVTSPFNPLPVYDRPTTLAAPSLRIREPHDDASAVDVMAVDALPGLLPREASEAFAADLFPHFEDLPAGDGVWPRAEDLFRDFLRKI